MPLQRSVSHIVSSSRFEIPLFAHLVVDFRPLCVLSDNFASVFAICLQRQTCARKSCGLTQKHWFCFLKWKSARELKCWNLKEVISVSTGRAPKQTDLSRHSPVLGILRLKLVVYNILCFSWALRLRVRIRFNKWHKHFVKWLVWQKLLLFNQKPEFLNFSKVFLSKQTQDLKFRVFRVLHSLALRQNVFSKA